MPSALHEALVKMFRKRPLLGVELLRHAQAAQRLPAEPTVQALPAEFSETQPEYRADVVLQVEAAETLAKNTRKAKETKNILIIEVQLGKDPDKRYTWPHYSMSARLQHRCPATVVAVAVDPGVAAWCRKTLETDLAGTRFRILVIGPESIPFIADLEQAQEMPELAVLSAVAHGKEPGAEAIGLAALAGCQQLDTQTSQLYADVVFANLGEIARHALEALMEAHDYEYQSDFAKKYVAEGRRALLMEQLEERFGPLAREVMERIQSAQANELSLWARRVLTAERLQDVFA